MVILVGNRTGGTKRPDLGAQPTWRHRQAPSWHWGCRERGPGKSTVSEISRPGFEAFLDYLPLYDLGPLAPSLCA